MRRVFEEVFNKGNFAIIAELIATNYVFLSPLGMEFKGPEGFKQMVAMSRTAFPNIHIDIDDIIAEGDRVAIRYTLQGTFKGDFMGISPTGKQITIKASLFVRLAGGKEVEAFEFFDSLAMYRQLGIPLPKE
jgi:steroid delta-isomerase-like uncharacterized protein